MNNIEKLGGFSVFLIVVSVFLRTSFILNIAYIILKENGYSCRNKLIDK